MRRREFDEFTTEIEEIPYCYVELDYDYYESLARESLDGDYSEYELEEAAYSMMSDIVFQEIGRFDDMYESHQLSKLQSFSVEVEELSSGDGCEIYIGEIDRYDSSIDYSWEDKDIRHALDFDLIDVYYKDGLNNDLAADLEEAIDNGDEDEYLRLIDEFELKNKGFDVKKVCKDLYIKYVIHLEIEAIIKFQEELVQSSTYWKTIQP